MKSYQPRKSGENIATGDIAIYSMDGTLDHSGKVVEVDEKHNPTKIRSKWGHLSLFEHTPRAVPDYYGTPSYYHRGMETEKGHLNLRRQCAHRTAKSSREEVQAFSKQVMFQSLPTSEPESPWAVPRIVHEVLCSTGKPLDKAARAYMEPRLGSGFLTGSGA